MHHRIDTRSSGALRVGPCKDTVLCVLKVNVTTAKDEEVAVVAKHSKGGCAGCRWSRRCRAAQLSGGDWRCAIGVRRSARRERAIGFSKVAKQTHVATSPQSFHHCSARADWQMRARVIRLTASQRNGGRGFDVLCKSSLEAIRRRAHLCNSITWTIVYDKEVETSAVPVLSERPRSIGEHFRLPGPAITLHLSATVREVEHKVGTVDEDRAATTCFPLRRQALCPTAVLRHVRSETVHSHNLRALPASGGYFSWTRERACTLCDESFQIAHFSVIRFGD